MLVATSDPHDSVYFQHPHAKFYYFSLKPNGQVDFSDPESVQQLTKSLLKRDFGLKLALPPDRLCPAVCNPPISGLSPITPQGSHD